MSVYTHSGDCSTSEPCPRCYEFGQTAEQARIIKLLKDKARSLKQIAESIAQDEYMNADDSDYPYWGALALDDFADALIKGENK